MIYKRYLEFFCIFIEYDINSTMIHIIIYNTSNSFNFMMILINKNELDLTNINDFNFNYVLIQTISKHTNILQSYMKSKEYCNYLRNIKLKSII